MPNVPIEDSALETISAEDPALETITGGAAPLSNSSSQAQLTTMQKDLHASHMSVGDSVLNSGRSVAGRSREEALRALRRDQGLE